MEAARHTLSVTPAQAGAYASFSAHAVGSAFRLCVSAAVATAALLAAGAAAAQMKPDTASLETRSVEIRARPIASFSKAGGAADLGRLEWRGGLVLSSDDANFGGWSGLVLSDDGTRLLAVSDAGLWMTGEIVYDESRPKAVRATRLGALRTLKGGPLTRLRDRDAEAVTLASGTLAKGKVFIAFEQNDRIGVFPLGKDGLGGPSSYLAMPKEAARMRLDGIEALAVLAGGPRKGALLAFAENPLRGEKAHRGWIWLSGVPRGFTVPDIGGFSITDAASLPDGSVLLLERRFRWLEGLHVRLRLLPPDAIRPGAAASGEILLEADTGMQIDNLEGLAVSRGANGETVLTLLSDDNFNRLLQRTVLLQFTLKDAETDAASSDPEAQSAATKR